jgi:hypothetical protein
LPRPYCGIASGPIDRPRAHRENSFCLGPAGARLSFGDSSPRHVSGSAVHLPTKNPVCCHHSDCGWFDYCHPDVVRGKGAKRHDSWKMQTVTTRSPEAVSQSPKRTNASTSWNEDQAVLHASGTAPSRARYVPYPTLQEGIRCGGMLHELAKSPARGSCSTAPSASARPWRLQARRAQASPRSATSRAGSTPGRNPAGRGRADRGRVGRGLCSKMCGGTGVGNPARLEADRDRRGSAPVDPADDRENPLRGVLVKASHVQPRCGPNRLGARDRHCATSRSYRSRRSILSATRNLGSRSPARSARSARQGGRSCQRH